MRSGALVLLLTLAFGAIAAEEPFSNRIVPVDPLLSRVSAADAAMTFYWPGASADGCGVCRLTGTVDGGTRQVLNYVVFRPYYTETPEEVAEVGRLCSAGCTQEEINREGEMR